MSRKHAKKSLVEVVPAELGERELIDQCTKVAAFVAAFHAAFQIDPDGNNSHAERVGYPLYRKGKKPLRAVTASPAATRDGIYAKARLVSVLLDDEKGSCPKRSTLDFIGGFAADVANFIRKEKDAEHAAAVKAHTNGSAVQS